MENYLYENEAIQMGTMRLKNSGEIVIVAVLSEAYAAAVVAAAVATVTAPSLLSY